MATIVEEARALAAAAHTGQTRRHGAPYLTHPVAVADWAEVLGPICGIPVDDEVRAVALLHDVLEDSDTTKETLAARTTRRVAERVQLLTKHPPVGHAGTPSDEQKRAQTDSYYAQMMAADDDAVRLVKACDRMHNLSELHLSRDPVRCARSVEETLDFVVPLARPHPGLVRALHDAIRAACRNQGVEIPAEARLAPGEGRGIYAILPPRKDLGRHLQALLDGGVTWVQLRAKQATDKDTLAQLEELLPLCRARGAVLIVNDRADLCLAAGADGVHVGQDDLPPRHARRILGAAARLGTSTHNLAEVRAACADGVVDHIAVGPIFLSPTKSGHAPVVGVEALAEAVRTATMPVVAIGGIVDAGRVAAVARAGASLAAVVSALDVDDSDKARRTARLFCLAYFAAAEIPS